MYGGINPYYLIRVMAVTLTAVKIVGDTILYAQISHWSNQLMPDTYFLNCDEMYAWKEDYRIVIAYSGHMKQVLNGEIYEYNGACGVWRGDDMLYSNSETREEMLTPVGTYIPDITVFNDSSEIAQYFSQPLGITWNYEPKFTVNTLKKGTPCL